MNAVILAGGFGSRLKPLTDSTPKPMLPVANVPMLDYVVAHLYDSGIRDTVLTLGYYPEQIVYWMEGYSGVKAHYAVEDVPLGTAGGVKEASDLLDERFIVVSGDALENIDFGAMVREHIRSGKSVTMAVTKVEDTRRFGLVGFDSGGTVTDFFEKPENAVGAGWVNCGVYVMERKVLRRVPKGEKYDFSRDLFPDLVARGDIHAYRHDGFWSDIGSLSSYYEANFLMTDGGFFKGASHRNKTVSRRFGSVDTTLAAYSSLVVGKARHCVIGEGAAVSSGADITDCVVMPYVTVSGIHVGEILGENCYLPINDFALLNRSDSTRIYKKFS